MTAPERMSGWTRLTTGTASVDIVGRTKLWYIGFGVLLAICLASLLLRGFNLGIDFTGGSEFTISSVTDEDPEPEGLAAFQEITTIYLDRPNA